MNKFPYRLIKMGYTKTGHRYGIDPDIHLFHNAGDTPAWDFEAITYAYTNKIPEIVGHVKDGRVFKANLTEFLQGAKTINFPSHGTQLINEGAWEVEYA